jgi:protocatechuate 3,4-dioxygenase beta subunit
VPGFAQRPGWLPERYWNEPHATARTDARGRFRIPGLAEGSEVAIWLRLEGFVPRFFREGELAAGGTDLPDLVLERSGAIRVRVIDERTGRPVEGAHARQRRVGEEEIGGGVVEAFDTDEDGFARVDGLAPGSYRVSAWRNGLARGEEAVVEVRAGATTEATVVLASAPGTDVELSLVGAGVPLDGAEISLQRLRGDPSYNHRETVEAGGEPAIFRDVPFGRYQLMATHTSYPGPVRREIDIAPGATRFELAFQEPAGGWVPVFGRVLDEGGRPVPGAKIYVSGSTPGLTGRYETVTDGAGRFTLEAVAAAEYWAEASAPGSGLRSARLRFEARPPRADEVVFTLRRGIEVTGAVRGLPVDEMTAVLIRATAEDALGMQQAAGGYVAPDGTYRLEGVTPGTWAIEAVWEGAAAHAEATVPEDAEALAGPDLVFAELHTVSGTLLYQGRPYDRVRVGLSPKDGPSYPRSVGTLTDEGGRFTLDPVSAGVYHFTVGDPQWGMVHSELLEVTGDLDRTFPLGAAMVSGEVLDAETGLPVPEARVNLWRPGATYVVSHAYPTWAKLDEQARFEVGPLAGGKWGLKASAEGYVPNDFRIDVQGEDLEGLIIPLTPTPGLDLLVRTAAGAVPEQVDLRLEDPEAGCTVTKHVLHPHGAAENRWPDAPPGEWELLAWDETGASARVPAAVPGPVVEVVLPALAKLEVRVPELEAEEGWATLQLLDANGRPAASRGCATEGQDRWPIRSNRRFYAFGLEPGVYEARVTAADGRAWSGTVDLAPGAGNAITLD